MRKVALSSLLTLTVIACASEEPERPDETDEARFEEIDAMLDEESDGLNDDTSSE